MADHHAVTAPHVAPAPRGAMLLPGWYPVVWAVVMLALLLTAPLVRLTHATSVIQPLEYTFLVLLLGSRLGLSAWRRAHIGVLGRGALPAWLLWTAQVVGTVGGFLVALAVTRAGHPVLAVVLSLLIVGATTAVLVHHNGGLRPDRGVGLAP